MYLGFYTAAVLAGKLTAQLLGQRVQLGQARVGGALPLLVAHIGSAQHLGMDIAIAAVAAWLDTDAVRERDALGRLDVLRDAGTQYNAAACRDCAPRCR